MDNSVVNLIVSILSLVSSAKVAVATALSCNSSAGYRANSCNLIRILYCSMDAFKMLVHLSEQVQLGVIWDGVSVSVSITLLGIEYLQSKTNGKGYCASWFSPLNLGGQEVLSLRCIESVFWLVPA